MKKLCITFTISYFLGLAPANAQTQNNMSKGPMILQPVRTRIEDSLRKEFGSDTASLRYKEYHQANDSAHFHVNDSSRRNTFNLDAGPSGIIQAVPPKEN